MHIRILDLDGSVLPQDELCQRFVSTMVSMTDWGPRLRMGCGWRAFQRFEQALSDRLDPETGDGPLLTLFGSGDFHHLTLALLRRLTTPFNLLVIDNHPDWMRGVPLLHCGTWVYHAASLPNVQTIFHVGGNDDFDDAFRWLAPWNLLRTGKIRTFPATRRFQAGCWSQVAHYPLRLDWHRELSRERLRVLLQPFQEELSRVPLYVSLDKDVMVAADAVTNWPAGVLGLTDVQTILEEFLSVSGDQLLGMDLLGDWSPVRVQGWLRRFLHLTEHPSFHPDPLEAARQNERTNIALLETIRQSQTTHTQMVQRIPA